MRYKELFTLYPRKLKNVTVFYYQCYDNEGKRMCGHSTGQRTKTAAYAYCMNLFREGRLTPEKKNMTFGEFSKGWWDVKTCRYLEWRQVQNPLAPATIDHYKTCLETHIKPYFAKLQLNKITFEAVQEWVLRGSKSGLTNSSINQQIVTLKIMMREAVRLKFLTASPLEKIKKLKADNREVRILKSDEVKRLFPADWRTVWENFDVYMFNKLAACTGMRSGELLGLRGEHIRVDHIHVCVQYSKKYGLAPLKTKDSRDIPITPAIYEEISPLVRKNGPGFLFSEDGGKIPVSRNRIYRETENAFDKIGIDREERKKRGIALHHWRHFLNTALLMANVNTLKVQKVTGHKSNSMTRHYAHFDSREFTEVLDVQNSLLTVK